MTRSILSAILLTLTSALCQVHAQNQFDVVYGLSANQWKLKMNTDDNATLLEQRIRGQLSKPEQRLGMNYHFRGKSPISLKTGVRMLISGFRTYDLVSLAASEKKELKLRSAADNTAFIKYDYDYYFVEVPIMAHWVYSDHGCDAFIEAGVSANAYLGTRIGTSKSNTDNPREKQYMREKLTPVHMKLLLSTGVATEIAENLPVFIQLVGNYQINPIQNGIWEESSFGFGVESGIKWNF